VIRPAGAMNKTPFRSLPGFLENASWFLVDAEKSDPGRLATEVASCCGARTNPFTPQPRHW